MSYHRFNNLAELINKDHAAKIGRGILSRYLMDIECNCSLPYKVNGKCVYEGKFRNKCLIYGLKFSVCDAIYIGNTHQTLKKILDSHLSNLLRLLKNGQKSDSLDAYIKRHLNATTSHIYIRKYVTFKVVKQLNLIGAMKTFTKTNCKLCMEVRLTILNKYVTNVSWL